MTWLGRCSLALALLVAPLMVVGCNGGNSKTGPVTRDGSSGVPDGANAPIFDANPDLAPIAPIDAPGGVADAAVDNRSVIGDSGPVSTPDAPAGTPDVRPVVGDSGPVSTPDAPASTPDVPADNRPVAGDGLVGTAVDNRPVASDTGPAPDAGSGTTLASPTLKLEVTPSPYSYKVTEISSGDVLVSQSATTFTAGSTAYATASASGFITTGTTLDATLALSGTTNTAHVKFTFTSPEVLQVLLTYNGGTPTNVKEQFNDQSEHYYGIWGYHLGSSGALDNRGADADLLGL